MTNQATYLLSHLCCTAVGMIQHPLLHKGMDGLLFRTQEKLMIPSWNLMQCLVLALCLLHQLLHSLRHVTAGVHITSSDRRGSAFACTCFRAAYFYVCTQMQHVLLFFSTFMYLLYLSCLSSSSNAVTHDTMQPSHQHSICGFGAVS